MKNLFTLFFLCFLFISLTAQKSQKPPNNPFPEDVFKYDQVLPAYQKPDHEPAVENSLLDVMFAESSKVRLRNGELIDTKSNATAGLAGILNQLASFEWQRFSDVSEELLDELSENGSRNTGQAVYNLNNIYRLRISENEDIWELSSTLEHLPGIIYARPVPKPAPLPSPGNFQNLQGYLDPAVSSPSGIDAEYAWTQYGGTGTGITICDIEYSWNYNHADLTKAVGSQINTNVVDPYNDNNHGTAVIGELISNNNGWGTTGICYNSNIKTCGAKYGNPATYNPAGAITLSIANLSAGDIILLEQQADYTGTQGYVPIEWYGSYSPNAQTNNPVYAAIVNAVSNNIHVVEAGGNGNVNTGSLAWYGNSGAVIVGAGGGYSSNNLKKLSFSSYGPRFDAQGWGENVMTTGYGNYYNSEGVNYYYRSDFNGTSSASPIVAGAIACFSSYWKQNYSSTPPTPANMRGILKRHGRLQVYPEGGHIGPRPDLKAMIKGFRYCVAYGGCDEYISRVQMGDIDNSSECNEYVNYTTIHSTDLPANSSQTLTVTNGTPYASDQCGVWVDWNRDLDFNDANETITITGNPGYGPYTANIAPPAGTTNGDVRMRIRINYTGELSPCGATTYGEVEDYTINVTAGVPNVWTGASNYYWHNADNWSLGHIPTATEDVIMTSAGYHPPIVASYDDACKNLTIQSGAGLIIVEKTLIVYGDLTINGNLAMNNAAGVLTVYGDVLWKSGSTAGFTASTAFNVYGNWTFYSGADANIANGTILFFGETDKYIRNYSTTSSFFNVGSYKPAGFEVGISAWSTQPLTIKGNIYVHPAAQFGIYSDYDVILKGNINSNGIFVGDYGTLKLDGAAQELRMNVGDYFNNLTFSQTGTVTVNNGLSSILEVNGNVLIESGVFNLADRTMKVGGNWTNTAGLSAFNEGTSRVIFNGTAHQNIYSDETFNILEANLTAAIRPHENTVICNVYDWTSGGIDVYDGEFTALDLAENGLFGSYYVNYGGVINLTNDGWVDLNGEIHNFGGTINVSGTVSDWPYLNDALIEMTGGVIDFKTCGISIRNNARTLTTNISGGIIRMANNFRNERTDVSLSNLIVEMYGPSDATLFLAEGKPIRNLNINKVASDGMSPSPQENRDGSLPTDNSRANNVNLISDIIVNYDVNINGGLLSLNGYETTVNHYFTVYDGGTIVMDNPADVITMSAYLNYFEVLEGGTAILSEGNIYTQGWIIPREGSSFTASTSNTISFKGNTGGGLSCYESSAVYGNIVINKNPGQTAYIDDAATEPLVVDGNVTINAGNIFELQNNTLNVHGIVTDNATSSIVVYKVSKNLAESSSTLLPEQQTNKESRAGILEIDTDFTLNGLLDIADGNVAVHGRFTMAATGSMIIDGGTFIADSPNHPDKGWEYIHGNLQMSDGLFEITHNSIYFRNTANTAVSGGILRSGGAFYATGAGVFEPTGGTVEIIGNNYDDAIYCSGGNYFYNLLINKNPALWSSFMGSDDVSILNDFTILSGGLYTNECDMFVGGNWANYVGPAAFAEGTGTVTFNGNWGQECSTEEFYRLVLNKPTGDLQLFSGQDVSCQIYQWLDGEIHVSSGIFTAYDLFDNGIFGDYYVDGIDATVDLYQDNSQYVDLNGSIAINNGQMNIYGGNSISYWPFASNASITMSGGVLDFKDVGIYIYDSPSYTLTENITGGVIRTSGSFLVDVPTFTPTGGIVELYGSLNAGISNVAGSNFYNLTINKSGADEGSEPFVTQDRNGETIMLSRANEVWLNSDVLINNNLSVSAGKLHMGTAGYDLTCIGSASIENGASLQIGSASQLKLNTSLTAKSGGTLNSSGALGFESWITRAATSRYSFNIQSGANIGASNTIFEYMGANGINIASGAVVDPAQAFNNCTFQQGLSANTLLTMNSTQTLECTGAIFPTNTWGGTNNVKKTNNAGRITFYDYSGGFAGSAYESDLYNRIDWYTPQLSASPLVINVSPPAGTATINVSSNLAWTATESSSWFSISPLSGSNNGTITVTYNQNTTTSARSGSIIISAPGVPNVIITVNQAGATLAVMPASRSVTAPAGATTFSVASNALWTVSESVSWLSVTPMSGTANGTLTVNYNQNTSLTPRSGQITVSSSGLPNVVVTVNQAGAGATLTVTPANRNVAPAPGATTFTVSSNTSWTVSESVAWFYVSPMSGSGNKTLSVSYGENGSGTTRVGSITLTATGGSPVATVTVSQSSYPTQLVALPEGWSGLSSYLMPANDDIEDIFDPVLDDFVIATTMAGIYYPAGPVNTIIDWASQSAYKVKMSATASLLLFGNPETNKTVNLTPGWSLVPVICNISVDAQSLFAGTDFEIVKDVAGLGILWPNYGINTLGNFLPGKAYYALMNEAEAITFPANAKDAEFFPAQAVELPANPWTDNISGPATHVVALLSEGFSGILAGDVIALFGENGKCYGISEIPSISENAVIAAYADDPYTHGQEGFASSENMNLKLFRPQSSEVFDVVATYDLKQPNTRYFQNEGLSVITALKVSALGINEASAASISLYPNPTNGWVELSGIKDFTKIEIYNANGKLIRTIEIENQDEYKLDLSDLPGGVYQFKFMGDAAVAVKKLIRN